MPEAALSDLAVYDPRPTVRVGGQVEPMLSELLIAMEMTEHEGGLSALELRVSNWASDPAGEADFAFENESVVALGSPIEVYAGEVSAPQEIFRGVVSGIEAEFSETSPPELVLLAEDALQGARIARRTRVHEDLSIADLARQVASELNLTPVVTAFDETIGLRVQLNESNLAFLRRLVRWHDGDLQVVGEELHVSPRADVRRGEVALEYQSQLREARVIADLARQCTEVSVSGWDARQGSRISVSGTGVSLGPGSGRTGAGLLRSSFGERAEHVGHLAPTTRDDGQALANAVFDADARRFVCLEGTAEGNPAIRVGSYINVTGLSSRFDNVYYVVRACHRFDEERGYETRFEAECAYLGNP